jgi:hypothetical protein
VSAPQDHQRRQDAAAIAWLFALIALAAICAGLR